MSGGPVCGEELTGLPFETVLGWTLPDPCPVETGSRTSMVSDGSLDMTTLISGSTLDTSRSDCKSKSTGWDRLLVSCSCLASFSERSDTELRAEDKASSSPWEIRR